VPVYTDEIAAANRPTGDLSRVVFLKLCIGNRAAELRRMPIDWSEKLWRKKS
jgi:hypothetical protein